MKQQILIKRNELYEQVWSKPLIVLAKEYKISDVGLSKICKKLNVPRPYPGYWRKKETGKPVNIPELPTLNLGELEVYELKIDDEEMNNRNIIKERLKKEEPQIKMDNIDIRVSTKLYSPDPRILETKNILQQYKTPDHLTKRYKEIFDIVVTDKLLERALRIFDTLIKILRGLNYEVVIDLNDFCTYAVVNKQKIRIRLIEIRKQIKLPDKNNSLYAYPTTEFHYTGKLSLQIYDTYKYSKGNSYNVTDTDDIKIESRLSEFISKLNKVSVIEQFAKEKHLEWERKFAEERKLQEEKQYQIKWEKEQTEKLFADSKSWHNSQILKSYIDAFIHNAEIKNLDCIDGQNFHDWVLWARNKVKELNPIKE